MAEKKKLPEATNPTESTVVTKSSTSSQRKWGLWLLLPVFFLGAAYITVSLFLPTPGSRSVQEETGLYKMSSIIVNLSGSMGKRYLKAEVVLEYKSAQNSMAVQSLIEKKQILLKDSLIMLLSSKTLAAVDGQANKELLKEEIRQQFQKILFSGFPASINRIYYESFMVQ